MLMITIYPSRHLDVRSVNPIEIDSNDPEFARDPTGLYAVYSGVEPVLLLTSTETPGHWDTVLKIRRVHFEKLTLLFRNVLPKL